jgi:cellulose synthase/poly-beta-1,6-N-acetylglucosamine synthase-like glycosyltransferase
MAENNGSLPFVSVFVPARDEEASIEECLRSLFRQDYRGKFEILMGDDDSSDNTLEIARRLEKEYPALKVFEIDQGKGALQGKQRALASLTEHAIGEVFLFCDADMCMPSGWIRNMVFFLSRGDGDLINGTTCTDGRTLFGKLQALDWLIPQAFMGVLSRMGLAYTAMGNNMGMGRKVYESVGGYGGIPFSVTEDYELYRQLKRKGFRLTHVFDRRVLGITRPSETMEDWFGQHLRWMRGFHQLALIEKIPVFGNLFLLPLAAGFVIFGSAGNLPTYFFLLLWFFRFSFQAGSLYSLRRSGLIPLLPVYELLFPPLYISIILTSAFRKNISWKRRRY